MTTDPKDTLARLRASIEGHNGDDVVAATVLEVQQILAMLKYQEDQLVALRAMLSGKPAKEAPANESVCQEADRIVSSDRLEQYGNPRDDFNRTATMWEALLGLAPGAIDPEKVAMCMIAVKLSRLCHGYRRDSIVDVCGYAKTIDLCRQAAPT